MRSIAEPDHKRPTTFAWIPKPTQIYQAENKRQGRKNEILKHLSSAPHLRHEIKLTNGCGIDAHESQVSAKSEKFSDQIIAFPERTRERQGPINKILKVGVFVFAFTCAKKRLEKTLFLPMQKQACRFHLPRQACTDVGDCQQDDHGFEERNPAHPARHIQKSSKCFGDSYGRCWCPT